MPTTIAAPKTKTVRSPEEDFLPLDEMGRGCGGSGGWIVRRARAGV